MPYCFYLLALYKEKHVLLLSYLLCRRNMYICKASTCNGFVTRNLSDYFNVVAHLPIMQRVLKNQTEKYVWYITMLEIHFHFTVEQRIVIKLST